MSEILGTIRILEGRIITKKNGVEEVWSRGGGDPNNYIIYNGLTYRQLNGKNQEISEPVKKYQEIEENDLDDETELF